jgi:GYF domain 2
VTREAAVWFVLVGGEQDGPLTRSELGLRCQSGALTPETQVWREGLSAWLPGAAVPELVQLFGRPAPERPKARLQPVRSGTARASEKAAAAARAPEEKQLKPGFGEGLDAFDTGHFRVAELEAKEAALAAEADRAAPAGKKGFGEGNLELDTGHFRIADLEAQREAQLAA